MRLNDLNVLIVVQLVIINAIACTAAESVFAEQTECMKKCDMKADKFSDGKREIHIGVLLPSKKSLLQGRNTVLGTILPAIELAVESITNTENLLTNCSIKIHHKDTDCSSIFGPLAAFDLHALGHAGKEFF